MVQPPGFGEFRVGVTRDFLTPGGEALAWGDIGLTGFDRAPWINWNFLGPHGMELTSEDLAEYDAVLVNEPAIRADALTGNRRLAVVARFGVGFDRVDVAACTAQGVLVTNTPGGVRRPVASSVLCLLLALAHRLLDKDKITRTGQWDERLSLMGRGLTGLTIGIVGFGNIGRETERLLVPFDARVLVADPCCPPGAVVSEYGAVAVTLPDLMRQSEFVVVLAPLSNGTHHLIGREELEMLGPTGYLINMSRGPVVDEEALIRALKAGVVQGAGRLDVFESEPLTPSSELVSLDRVILTPHSLCWTSEMAHGCGAAAIDSIIRVSRGEVPENVVDPQALRQPDCVRRMAEYEQARRSHASGLAGTGAIGSERA